MKHHRFKSDLAFLDMLFNMVLAFAFLFVVALLLIRPPAPPIEANVKMKAEFVLTMNWPEDALDDVDMWVMLPSGTKVYYLNKDPEFATLDRDDRGGRGDTLLNHETQQYELIKRNEEVITLRAVVPGRYVVSGHLFATVTEVDTLKSERGPPHEVSLKLLKLNPRVETAVNTKIVLEQQGQEIAFVAFTVESDGTISNIELNPIDMIVHTRSRSGPHE